MASGITDFGAEEWLLAAFDIATIGGFYIALATSEPGRDADGDTLADLEPTDAAYARQVYGNGPTYWGTNGPAIATLADINFGVATADWGLITHFVLCTAAVSGDVYGYGQFLNPQMIQLGNPVLIPAGGIVVSSSSLENSIDI